MLAMDDKSAIPPASPCAQVLLPDNVHEGVGAGPDAVVGALCRFSRGTRRALSTSPFIQLKSTSSDSLDIQQV